MAVNEHDTAGTPQDERIVALYREAALEEPPSRLDAVIARDARRALEPPAAGGARPWWQIWRVPVAFAAVAVLSVSVATIISREGGEPLTIGERAPMPQASSSAAPRTAPQQDPSPAAAQPSGEVQPQTAQSERRKVDALQREERRRDSSARSERSTVPRSEPGSPSPASAADAAGKLGEVESRTFTDRSKSADTGPAAAAHAPYALSAPSAAPAPAAPPDARLAKEAPAASAPPVAARRRSAATPAAKPAMPAGTALTPAVAALVAELEGKAPAAWLERVAALRRDGRTEDADALLNEFRRRHPEAPLPEDLK
ncbi:MAG: hypothetical protein JWO70_5139 [Betaproteobacteria bacterium]|nr:hypothetical protein [Betaproteobacteria bacterium]